MNTPIQGQRRAQVLMLAYTNLDIDARIQKTAEDVAALGYDVTVLWGNETVKTREESIRGTYRSIAVPAPLTRLRHREARRIRRRGGEPTGRPATGSSGLTYVWRRLASASWWRWNKFQHKRPARWWWRAELPELADIRDAFLRIEADAPGPDIIHAHDVHLLEVAHIMCGYLSRDGRTPALIYDAHEYVRGVGGRARPVREAWAALEAKALREAEAVITVSESIARRLQVEHGLAEEPITVLNAPRLNTRKAGSATVRKAAGITRGTPLVIYSGIIAARRGVRELLSAVARIESLHVAYVCVPSTDTAAVLQLKRDAEELSISDRAHFVEPVAPDEVAAFLADADAAIIPLATGVPNNDMALPNKLFETVHAGVPIVASNTTAMSKFLEQHPVGVTFTWGDEADFERALRETLARAPEFREEIEKSRLSEQYSWESQVSGLSEAYSRASRGRTADETAPVSSPE